MTSPMPTPGSDPAGSSDPATSGSAAPATSAPAPVVTAAPLPTSLPKETSAALQRALGAENAAVWAYGLVSAHDPDNATLIAAQRDAHLVRRNDVSARLSAAKQKPLPASPAYDLPSPITDKESARAAARTIESDCAAAWLGVVGATDSADLRGYALAGLMDAALRLTAWKGIAKVTPLTVPFPGRS